MEANEQVVMGRGLAWGLVLVFLGFIALPGLWRNASELVAGPEGWVPALEFWRVETPRWADHRDDFEQRLEADFVMAETMRSRAQALVTTGAREGNAKTFIGRDGWLFYRPALASLTRGAGAEALDRRIEIIEGFARQLEARGIQLILVPVPSKPTVYPEKVSLMGREWLARPSGAAALEQRLRERGVEIVDLGDALARWTAPDPLFLRQDTHWSPAGMALAARRVAESVRERPWFDELSRDSWRGRLEEMTVAGTGDLVEMLGSSRAADHFGLEDVTVERLLGEEAEDTGSSLVLLGDSFVNVFDDPSLGLGEGAGFAQHLAHALGMPLEVIAINGGGATGVRRELLQRPGGAERLRGKRAVIWVLSEREIYLPEAMTAEEGVTWEAVDLVEGVAPAEPRSVSARLEMVSPVPDPRLATYRDALFAAIYRTAGGEALRVYHWGFRERELTLESRLGAGDEVALDLVPLGTVEEVKGVYRSDETGRDDLVPWFGRVR